MHRIFILIAVFTLSLVSDLAAAQTVPQFSSYPASATLVRLRTEPVLDTPEKRNFRTRIRDASRQPPNFAGEYLRAYCTPMLIFQDMAQLRDLYRRAGSFLANATCKVFFNVADLDAARFVSEMIGQTTTVSRNEGTSHANTDSRIEIKRCCQWSSAGSSADAQDASGMLAVESELTVGQI